MLECPKCKSSELKVWHSKPRDVKNGKTRMRQCLKCKIKFTTLESVYVIQELPKPKKKIKQASQPLKRPKKRKLVPRKPVPSIEVEPDFDSMSDDELESFIFNK
jgi:transcriptional regulator NrdR family protein